jgi:cytochrome P450
MPTLKKCIIILAIYLPSVYAVACEPFIDVDSSEPQTLEQAKDRLSNHLLAQDQAPFKQDRTAKQMIESMDCYLNAIAQHIQLLQQTALQLKQLGLALENWNSPDSTLNALNRIN